MNGRLEKELNAQEKMEKKLMDLPQIFKNYYLYLRAAKKTYNTINVYLNNVIHFVKFVSNGTIDENFYIKTTPEDIESYLISLETIVKNGEVQRSGTDIQCARWSALHTFYEFLVKRNYIKDNPVARTTRPKNTTEHSVTFLTKQEIRRLMNAIDNNPSVVFASRDKAIIGLLLATGLRVSAATNINIEDVDFENSIIKVVEKGNKVREISIGDRTAAILKQWIDIRNKTFGHIDIDALFISQKNNRISVYAIGDMIKKYAKEAGISKHITPHKMRSTCATQAAAANVPILAISKQLGHNNVSTTQRYLDVLNDDKNKMLKVSDNLF